MRIEINPVPTAVLAPAKQDSKAGGCDHECGATTAGSAAAPQAEALLAAIVASSSDAIISKSLDGTITSWNGAAERLFGYAAREIVGQSIRILIPAELQAEEDEILARIARGETLQSLETTRRAKDGRLIPVSLTSSPVLDASGRIVGSSKIIRDITERKATELENQLLMREVNHRAKNVLTVVNAIARQTAAGSPEDFLARFSARVRALAANQDLLVSNDWHSIEMRDLVVSQLAPFADLLGTRIVMNGGALRVRSEAAQSLGMALHELATNAAKHGALAGTDGVVAIAWGAGDNEFALTWTEAGGSRQASEPQRRGFGRTVIEDMTRRKLGGTSVLSFPAEGARWRLVCPLASVTGAAIWQDGGENSQIE